MSKLTEEEINDLAYFWEDKGDLERYCYFEDLKPKIQQQFPELLKAWYDYKASVGIMNAVIKNLSNDNR
jgi:hypothetical protein